MRIEKIIKIGHPALRAVKKAVSAELEYEKLTGRKLGITGEVGELLTCQKLKLNLVANPLIAGYDAIDKKGRRYQIKTRHGHSDRGRTSRFSEHDFDYAVLVILDKKYKVSGLWQTTYKKLRPVLKRLKRRNPSLREFKRISKELL
ncbi:MAG: hypothetical protein Q7S09_04995 [bacterium]|nr:hypothetical protein [bacterium]